MTKNRILIKFERFFFIALAILVIAYVGFDRMKVRKSKVIEQDVIANRSEVLTDSIVEFGMQFLGTPYVAGGCGKDGFDCSGFVYFVFQHFNIEIPRSSADFEHFGKEIPIEDIQKGDLLLFLSPTRNVIGHIGIVSEPKGKESHFIHASSGREMKVIISNLGTDGFKRRFVKAVRVVD